ncbi:MAG: hypothetical protein HC821_05050 [Lewinella sp.]|nr:hypothetical protein [Lewinella sp.]
MYILGKIYQTDNTFQELMNSGNFTIISNDSIKNEILTVDKLYKKLEYTEDHFRYDAEIALYDPSYDMVDIHSLSNNYIFQKSAGNEGALGSVNENDFREMLKDQRQKNGFAFAAMYFNEMNVNLAMIKEKRAYYFVNR